MNGQITKGWLSTFGLAIVSIFIALPIVAFSFSQKLQASQATLLPADLPEIDPSPNGILSTGIDLSIPMATGEANVDLSLVFTGLGLLGNWDLSGLSSIQRERSAGIQFQQTDQYVSSIGGRLLEFNGNYYTEVDNGAMYQPQGNCGQGPCSWYVLLPDSALSKLISPVNTGAGTPNQSRCKTASDWCLVANFSDFLNLTTAPWATIACGLFQIDETIGRCETGALVRRNFPSVNISLRYDYHIGGGLATMQIEDPDRRILGSGSVLNVVKTSKPDALGNIAKISYGNGVTIDSSYSAIGTLKQVTTNGNEPLSDFTYHWNDEGMLVEKQDLLMADGINRSEKFVYDHSRRLIEATGPYGSRNAPRRTIHYAYGVDGQPIVADDKAYHYDVSNQHRLTSYNQRVYTYDNVLSPDKHKGLVMERRAPGNVVSRFQYHWTGRIKQAQTINGATITTVDYEYDTEG
ncbi:MAG: hypothetical protein H3C43_11120, partial [Leptonema sp. (in: Bacteria)]|nr:hypothetical protein [Leptonema sp. (in: bacteria)]